MNPVATLHDAVQTPKNVIVLLRVALNSVDAPEDKLQRLGLK
jgi:hypothetical protein